MKPTKRRTPSSRDANPCLLYTSEETEKDQVLVAYDLTPSDTAAMDASLIHGFATEIGSSVSVSYTHLDVYKRQVLFWCV